MFEKLPSLLGFQPKFYPGGPARFHLPLLYDLVACKAPKSIVVLGYGDGQPCFTFCQASCEQNVGAQCTVVRKARAGEDAADDLAWRSGVDYGQEFYGPQVRFIEGSAREALSACADNSVDLLLLDDCDSASEIRADLASWEGKLSQDGLVLLHGLELERVDGPRDTWKEWIAGRPAAEIPDGIGLGVAARSRTADSHQFLFEALFGSEEALEELIQIYRIAAARIDAQAQADQAVREQAALGARQVWLDSLLADRWKVQEIMDHQARELEWQTELPKHFEILRRDRAKAQLVMDAQGEQLKHWVAESDRLKAKIEQLKTQIKDQKAILSAAKKHAGKADAVFTSSPVPKSAGHLERKSCARFGASRAIWDFPAGRNLLRRRWCRTSRSIGIRSGSASMNRMLPRWKNSGAHLHGCKRGRKSVCSFLFTTPPRAFWKRCSPQSAAKRTTTGNSA